MAGLAVEMRHLHAQRKQRGAGGPQQEEASSLNERRRMGKQSGEEAFDPLFTVIDLLAFVHVSL